MFVLLQNRMYEYEYNRVEWLALFSIFEHEHIDADQGISSITKGHHVWPARARHPHCEIFIFKKFKGTFKVNIFLSLQYLPLSSKNNLQKES